MLLPEDTYRRIVAAKRYMDDHLHEAIDLDAVARQACFSRFHFHRLFTRIYRRTPHQYLTSVRLDAARVLLEEEGVTVTEVCNGVGFESLGSFSLLFRKKTGITPQRYSIRARHRKKESLEQPRKYIPHCFIESYHLDPDGEG